MPVAGKIRPSWTVPPHADIPQPIGADFRRIVLQHSEVGALAAFDGADLAVELEGIGGGQFAHRFLYLHPHRLAALSVGAPGNVTLPDPAVAWPAGVGGLEKRFGIGFDNEAVQAVPIHLVVGSADTETWEIAKHPGDPVYIGGVNDEATNRIVRLKRLQRGLKERGASTRFDLVEGAAHDGPAMVPAVTRWMERRPATVRQP